MKTRLALGVKIRLVAVFAATLLTTVASLYYIYAALRVTGITAEFAATVHVSIMTVVPIFVFSL